MAQPGNFTPILLYGSSTPTNVPLAANLTNSATGSEIAINVADKNLFFKDSGGVVNTVPIRQSSASSNGWLSSTDWSTFNSKAPATSGTSILYGNGSGGFSNVTIGSGISFAGGTLSATGTGGTVTSVAALTLGTTGTDLSSTVANGTTTPVITLNVPTASAANRGALSAADWSTFNGKQATLVSGTNIKTVGGVTLLGSGDVGTIGTGYGGTGLTSFTANGIVYASSTSALTTGSALNFSGSNLGIGVATSSWSGFNAIEIGTVGNAIWGTVGSDMYVMSGVYYNSAFKYAVSSKPVSMYEQASGQHFWYYAGAGTAGNNITFTTGMTLDSSGNLLIGTTSSTPTGTNNSIIIRPGLSSYFSASNTNSATFNRYTASGVIVNLDYAGSTVGTIATNGTVCTFNSISDYRLKTVIASVSDAGQRIDALEPIEYDWNTGGRTRGFLAHKFAEVYPDSVSGEKDAIDKEGKPVYQSMQPSSPEVMADLIAEIQSLRKRIATLESK